VVDVLVSYKWPGNVRELENLIEYLFVISGHEEIMLHHLPANIKNNYYLDPDLKGNSFQSIVQNVEKKVLLNALKKNTSLRKAANKLKISPATLSRKARKYNISVSKMK
jgi:transcriptional regulator with PAS, ATPase and Fis domain